MSMSMSMSMDVVEDSMTGNEGICQDSQNIPKHEDGNGNGGTTTSIVPAVPEPDDISQTAPDLPKAEMKEHLVGNQSSTPPESQITIKSTISDPPPQSQTVSSTKADSNTTAQEAKKVALKPDTKTTKTNDSPDQEMEDVPTKDVVDGSVSSTTTKDENSFPVVKTLKKEAEPTTKEALLGDQKPTIELPSWYDPEEVSSVEIKLLPEWFDHSSSHRTSSSYITARERIIDLARKSVHKYITGTAIRRSVPGDVGSLMRLHQFLLTWGFINGSAIGDSAPTEIMSYDSIIPTSTHTAKADTSDSQWTGDMLNDLAVAVASHVTKKRTRDEVSSEEMVIDWESVAEKVGEKVSALDCYNKFLSTNLDKISDEIIPDDATEVTVDTTEAKGMFNEEEMVSRLIDGVSPAVAQAAVNAGLEAANGNVPESQKATLLAMIATKASDRAREEEDAVSGILQEILDQRMAKLENRLSLLDDLEAMFDTERMALELERRDLYTTRCRHWFS
mmetsp:Transcript_1419/g.1755  ORF Transcript_1419/g.1755 Transcript_1419/m.1755 type:complete len:504 (+) Transcript_1419:3-1514(+)